uniref:Putative secreted protein n=1 Tax=Anopheles darlingi TaxID=43151 RepID=A0A2M4DLT7_ANODA
MLMCAIVLVLLPLPETWVYRRHMMKRTTMLTWLMEAIKASSKVAVVSPNELVLSCHAVSVVPSPECYC